MSQQILLVNPNSSHKTTNAMVEMAQAEMHALSATGITVVGLTVEHGPRMLIDEESLRTAEGQTTHAVQDYLVKQRDPVRAVIVAAFGDPGLDSLRQELTVPVVGIGESAIKMAADIGQFSIATTTPLLERSIRAQVERSGLTESLVSIQIPDQDPLYLSVNEKEQSQVLEQAVRQAAAEGAQAVIIGGGPLAHAADGLGERLAVPVINPVHAGCHSALRALRPFDCL